MCPLVHVFCVFAMGSETISSNDDSVVTSATLKKTPRHMQVRDVAAKLKLQSHETGPNCQCMKNCFQEIGHNKTQIINRMNRVK